MATFDEFYASLDPDAGIRGRQFEKFVKWYLTTDPIWATQVDKVWLWNEYPKRWGVDCGIDLIFTHKNGKTWAVQAKCISPQNDIKKSEIDSFLSESNDSKIDGRLLIASTDGIGKNALQVINRQEKQVVCYLLEQFRQSEISFPLSINQLNPVDLYKKKSPKPHQIEAIKSISSGIKTVDRGQVLMACGTGKTLTALWIKENLNAHQVLVLVPSLSLLSQTLKEWNANANMPFKWICVCSDKSVAKDKNEDEWISNVSEIGVPVTNDQLEIKHFLDEDGSKVIFSTYQSAGLIVEAQEFHDTNDFDLVIADEAHRCAGRVSDAFGSVLDDKKIRSTKRLFFTATPRILSKRIKSKSLDMDFEIASMDDYSVFGKVLYQLKFSEAIAKDLLTDYQVVVIGVDDELIKQKIINRDFIKIDNELILDAETIASQIAITKALKEYDLNRVITFHSRIKSAKDFAETFNKAINNINQSDLPSGIINCEHISGSMQTSERNRKLNNLRNLVPNERRILTNAKCLSEGVDVPSLSGIAFINPKQSQVDIIQAVGRAIRQSKDKTKGTIVIPLYISEEESLDETILLSNFKKVWQIVTALKSQDDLLMDCIDQLRIQLGERGSTGSGSTTIEKIIFDIPERITANFSKSINTYLVENSAEDWFYRFGQLRNFYNKNKNTNISLEYSPTLYSWALIQRKKFRRGQLTKQKINLLESIQFVWDPLEKQWQDNYQLLKDFFLEEGHSSPSKRINKSLSDWVIGQRKLYKRNLLPIEKIKLLENIQFKWDPNEEQWQENYQLLKEFFLKEGHSNPGRNKSELGIWAKNQRTAYQQNKLTLEKINLLESIEFIWDTYEKQWQENYQLLKDFYLKEGHSTPKRTYNKTLNQWSNKQRNSYKQNKLTQEKIELLEKIQFKWNPTEDQWNDAYNKLKSLYLKEGNSNLKYQGYSTLYRWQGKQREDYKKGFLSKEKVDLLEQIEFIWDLAEYQWQDSYKQLKEFFLKEGNSNPLSRHPLGSWCGHQREDFKKGKLSAEKKKLLDEINFIWDVIEYRWQENYQLLKDFYLKEGHSSPTRKFNKSLSSWVIGQRKLYKNNGLSAEHIHLLESIEFIWDPLEKQWQENYQLLKDFYLKEGHSSPSIGDEKELGTWCATQRKAFKSKQIDFKRINLLEKLNFIWDIDEFNWIDTFKQLKTYKEKYGNLFSKKNTSIYQKIRSLRNSYRKGFLSKEKISSLEDIGFIWNEKDYEWELNYEKLKKFADEYGTLKGINKVYPELVNWINGNKQLNSSYKLTNQRKTKLNEINGWYWK